MPHTSIFGYKETRRSCAGNIAQGSFYLHSRSCREPHNCTLTLSLGTKSDADLEIGEQRLLFAAWIGLLIAMIPNLSVLHLFT